MTIIMAVFSYIYSNIIFIVCPLVPLLYSLYMFDISACSLYMGGWEYWYFPFHLLYYGFFLPLPAIRKLLSLVVLDILLSVLITLFFKSVIVKMEPFSIIGLWDWDLCWLLKTLKGWYQHYF